MMTASSDVDLLKRSKLLDAGWYAAAYPDVATVGIEPADHYLRFGAKLLRDPGPGFSTRHYLDTNPDVAAAQVNPLVHYLQYGQKEGRTPLPCDALVESFAEAVDIVVTVFDALDDTQRCLEAVRTRKDGFAVRCVVVNDGSSEETTSWLRKYCDEHSSTFQLIEHGTNRGYTRAINTGLRASSAPYIVTLNSDAIVTRGWLRALIRCLRTDPTIGIAGPVSNAASWQSVPEVHDESGRFAINALPSGMSPEDMAGLVASNSVRAYPRVPLVNGFCLMMRRAVIDAVGFMDEESFPTGYGEENDYCLRAANAGYSLAIADDAYVFHAKSKSFGPKRRDELSRLGSQALHRKYSQQAIQSLVSQMKATPALQTLRRSVAAAIEKRLTAGTPVDPLSIRVVFVLPVRGGGGGAHSVVQEVAEMRRLGVEAVVAVRAEDLDHFQSLYRDIDVAAALFKGFTAASVADLGAEFDVVVGTIFDSMSIVAAVCEAHPDILPAYYVQDYEPLFFQPQTLPWRAAKDSYKRVANAVLFAKTRWIAERVEAEHDVEVRLVSPSIDHEVYRPKAKGRSQVLRVCAMVRPQTPRRGAQRTMRVLKAIAGAHVGRVDIRLFGCESESPLFQALPRDFPFENLGVLERHEVAAVLAASDVFVDLSDYQAFGRTALEAMACGCTALVPATGGSDEYAIDGVNSLVVDSQDEADCVSRLDALLRDDAALRRLQLCALETASRYSVRRAVVSELTLFAQELGRFRQPRQARSTSVVPLPRKTPSAAVTPGALAAPRKLPITALVITWDVGHNPLGRSYMLAEVLDRVVRNVVIAGFQFSRYGADIWEPLRTSRIPVIGLPGAGTRELAASIDRIAERIRPDIVIACKPRLPSLQLAAAIKQRWGCPLVVDIDDHELSFFKNGEPLTLDDLSHMQPAAAAGADEPFGELWTRLSETLVDMADDRIVSNTALQRRFGGTIVPHVRDETRFDPAQHSKLGARAKFGVPADARVVLFFGTPRLHKGVSALAEAVGASQDPRMRLVIVGSAPDKSVTHRIDELAKDRAICIPNQPFDAIPEVLAMADVVCLPQDENNPISHYQLPAKAIDAVAMGVPLLVSKTEPLMQLVSDGVATLIDAARLKAALEEALAHPPTASTASDRRARFLARYSYDAAAQQMRTVIERALGRTDKASVPLDRLVREQQRLLGTHPRVTGTSAGRDHVLFWKQNDTTLYGRRHDMVIKYLASRPDVRKVVVFDAPISEFDLVKRRQDGTGPSQDRWIYVRTYEKLLGKHDTDKVSYNVFLHPPGKYASGDDKSGKPSLLQGYVNYLEEVFRREGVQPGRAVFWMYPKNYLAPAIVDRFKPARVVVDVVDDHRAWPGVTDVERAKLTENYRATLAQADVAFVNCEPMQQSMREFMPAIRLVPNGCDLDPPRVEPRGSSVYDAFKAWPGGTIGFVGNLEAKIDIALIGKLAQRFKECQVVLLGSTHANPAVRELERHANVRMPGVVPYEQIGAWMSRFDVAIVPHLDVPMTKNMNPLKLYVYLAANIPVVSTEIYNIDRDTDLLRVAKTHDEFLEQTAQALAAGRPVGSAGSYTIANSWERRFAGHVDEVHATIEP